MQRSCTLLCVTVIYLYVRHWDPLQSLDGASTSIPVMMQIRINLSDHLGFVPDILLYNKSHRGKVKGEENWH